MVKEKIEAILADVASALPEDLQFFRKDIEKNLRATLNATFSKMELVTREEFDIQTASLQRTRTQLDALQEKLSKLEEQLDKTKNYTDT
ncbi:MAG TPA: accessory factor UbiK family protein [Thiotrichaceae bacterium]|jgi:BMFP domain-containing protein YqiC|nr:accessory factor UbiK family protein [Thiotrichaceae bacterium]HIM07273.1 accessory factor UbiK family protein [Gammaproteobacteria bacterium]